jgi:molybdopterin-guanine dinucleotide biosynthesis protein
MQVLIVAGPSNTGKTRLIDALLKALGPCLVLKWTHHQLAPDGPPKDTATWAPRATGTILAGPDAVVWRGPYRRLDLYRALARAGVTRLLVEGDKSAPWPKVFLSTGLPAPAPVALWVAPIPPPDPTVSWFPAELPLSSAAVAALSDYIIRHWETLAQSIV